MATRPPISFTQVNTTTAIQDQFFNSLTGEVTLLKPNPLILSTTIDQAWRHHYESTGAPDLSIFTRPSVLETLEGTLHETLAADLYRADALRIYKLEPNTPKGVPQAIDGNTVHLFFQVINSLTSGTQSSNLLTTKPNSYREHLEHAVTEQWRPPTTSLETLLEDFTDTFSPTASAYPTLVSELLKPHTNYEVDRDDLLLLAGGIDTLQLYELTEWAEAHNLSSRSTLNRKKNRLIEDGVLSITRESKSSGRPRQILNISRQPPDEHRYYDLLDSYATHSQSAAPSLP